MSVGFVTHSYHVPPHLLLMAIGLPSGASPDTRLLATIASAQGRSLDRLQADLQYAIVHARTTVSTISTATSESRAVNAELIGLMPTE